MSAQTDPTGALLRRALDRHLENVMSTTDTELELSRFQDGLRRRRSSRRWPAVAAASLVALGLAGAGAYALSADGPPSSGDVAAGSRASLTGDLQLVQAERGQGLPGRSDQSEDRGWVFAGPVQLVAARTARSGTATLTVSSSTVNSAAGPSVVHAWGTARLVLEDTTCTGPFGLSWYYDPAESGGAMHLLCEDGSALLATPVVTRFEPDTTDTWFIDFRLDDGTFIAG